MRTLEINLRLAKLGDAYVNFVVSAALTIYKGEPVGAKVPGKVLTLAYSRSQLSTKCVNSRRVEKSEVVEALFGYAWLSGLLDAEKGVKKLVDLLKRGYTIEDGLAELTNFVISKFDEVRIRHQASEA